MTPPKQAPVTDGVLEMLVTALAPIKVGDGEAPKPPASEQRPILPYVVLYWIPGGGFDGAANSDNAESLAEWVYQATVVGTSRGHVEFAKDKVHAAFLGRDADGFVHAITVAGATVGKREHLSHVPTDRQGDLWQGGELFLIGTALAL